MKEGFTKNIIIFRDSQQLFVGNLPHNCSEEELHQLFSQYGKVVEVRINTKQVGREGAQRGRDGKPAFVSIILILTASTLS